jgi:prophage regulatory protein
MPKKLLRLPDVQKQTDLSEATLRRLRKAGEFPEPLRLSPRRIAWEATAIMAWLESRTGAEGEA